MGVEALALALLVGQTETLGVEVRLSAPGRSWSGRGRVERRADDAVLEAELRGGARGSATVSFRRASRWLRVFAVEPGQRSLRRSGRADTPSTLYVGAGRVWVLSLQDVRVTVRFDRARDDSGPRDGQRRDPRGIGDDPYAGCGGAVEAPPPPEDEPPAARGTGCGGEPVESPSPEEDPGGPASDEGTGCGGDPVRDEEPGTWDDGEGTGCGGDPVREEGPWGPSDDDASGCGGDPVEAPDDNGELGEDPGAGCEDIEGDEVDTHARVFARWLRFAWPFILVLGINRGARWRLSEVAQKAAGREDEERA